MENIKTACNCDVGEAASDIGHFPDCKLVKEIRSALISELEEKVKEKLEKCEYCKKIVDVDCKHYDHFGNQALDAVLNLIKSYKP